MANNSNYFGHSIKTNAPVIGYAFVAASYKLASQPIYSKGKTYTAQLLDNSPAYIQTFTTDIRALNFVQKCIDNNSDLTVLDIVKVETIGDYFYNERNKTVKCSSFKVIDKWSAANIDKNNAEAKCTFMRLHPLYNKVSYIDGFRKGTLQSFELVYDEWNLPQTTVVLSAVYDADTYDTLVQIVSAGGLKRKVTTALGKFKCDFTYLYANSNTKQPYKISQQLYVNPNKPSNSYVELFYNSVNQLTQKHIFRNNRLVEMHEYLRDNKGRISTVIRTVYKKDSVEQLPIFKVQYGLFGNATMFSIHLDDKMQTATVYIK